MDCVLIVGGGLVGSVLAMFLSRLGYRVTIAERNPDPRVTNIGGGRSINLTLCERGLAPLERIGIRERVQDLGIPALGRIMHATDGTLSHQPYGNHGETLYSVPRDPLNATLIDLAEEAGVTYEFGMECLDLDLDVERHATARPAATFRRHPSGGVVTRETDRIFGADGAYSNVRLELQRKTHRFDLSQHHVEQVYKELSAPPAADGGWPLDPAALHIWPRGRFMLIAFANPDRSFTLSLHLPLAGRPSLASVATGKDLVELFEAFFPDALPLIPDLAEQFFGRKPASMVTVRCFPWICGGRVALVGDAAHAIVPSYGQGANAGFEDCAVLADCLEDAGGDWDTALADYQDKRKPHADAIADLALAHFRELQDLVGDPVFQLRKKLELRVNQHAPERFTPLYNLVSFTSIPYGETVEMERRQRRVIDRLMAIEDIAERVDDLGFASFLDRTLGGGELVADPR